MILGTFVYFILFCVSLKKKSRSEKINKEEKQDQDDGDQIL